MSQAFDRKLPIVEANSMRVLSRFFGYRADPREGKGKAWVWATAEAVLPDKRVGDFNQALMELGALICTPTTPECGKCPLRAKCVARRDGLQEQIPPRKKPPTITPVNEVGVVIRAGAKILLCKRPANANRWQNMWEVPHAECRANEDIPDAAVRIARELTGLTVKVGGDVMTIRHAVTRFRITLVCVEATVLKGKFTPGAYTEAQWVKLADLGNFPVSAPQRRLMRELARPSRTWP